MAKKPQKTAVEELVKNLVESEVELLQALAKDMSERVKQLEEHTVKIKQYTNEIEKLKVEGASEKADKAGMQELVRNMEKTIEKLRKKQEEDEEALEVLRNKKSAPPQKLEVAEEQPEERAIITRGQELPAVRGGLNRVEEYTTPEGFIVRKIRQNY